MKLTLLKEYFAGFLRSRHIAHHFRRLALLESVPQPGISRDVPPSLAQTLASAANSAPEALLKSLDSHMDGLTEGQVETLRAQVGLNEVEHEKPLPWWIHLWHCYKNPFNLLLTLLATISFLTDDLQATIVISAMVMTGAIMLIGIGIPMGPLVHYFKRQALPPLYFLFLPLILFVYMGLTQAVKSYYTRCFGWQ
ncbi:MAG: cation-transporting P-type ATPase [Azovibrio sp.]